MASLMQDLIVVLEQENSEYELLLELSNRKTGFIVAAQLLELEKITDEEQIVVNRIHQLENKRENLMNDIANVINKDVKTLKLVNLVQMLGNRPDEQEKLSAVHERLKDTMKHMVRVNDQNRDLLGNALEMVQFDLNLIQALRSAPETANYNKGAYASGSVIANQRSGFDAKQ